MAEMLEATKAGFHYLALHFAVSLPDICAALAEPPAGHPGRGVEGRYVDWCRKYLEPKYTTTMPTREDFSLPSGRDINVFLTAEDCWKLRGGIVHQATLAGRKGAPIQAAVFSIGQEGRGNFHLLKAVSGQVEYLQIDLVQFCNDVAKSVDEWVEDVKADTMIVERLDTLVSYRNMRFMGIPMRCIA